MRSPTAPAAPMPGPAARSDNPEFREIIPWPPGLQYLDGPTERVMQGQLPPRPDYRSYVGSSADLAANHEFAERGGGDLVEERRAPTPRSRQDFLLTPF
jgi:hypothetical protein